MKIPCDWLAEFVDFDARDKRYIQDLAEQISLKAFEVVDLEEHGADICGEVLVGQIEHIAPHPNADKLQITKVNVGNNTLLEIVCGARNIAVGQHVPVAMIGASVLNRHEKILFKIKKSKIRNVESQGMLCSGAELGIECEDEGILILPDSTKIGMDVVDFLGLKKKYVLNIESRSNREDALSIVGYAREIGALTGSGMLHDPMMSMERVDSAFKKTIDELPPLKINCELSNDCESLLFCRFDGVSVVTSPMDIQAKLTLSGMKPINIIVDILNLVMLELGQPMHAYDINDVDLETIDIRRAKSDDTRFSGLDGEEHQLSKEKNLIISDKNSVLSLAGILGSSGSAIKNDTTSFLLEIGCFDSATIRKSARSVGLNTESSRRFERGLHQKMVCIAFLRVCELFKQHLNVEPRAVSYLNEKKPDTRTLTLSTTNYTNKTSGNISVEKAASRLASLGCTVENISNSDVTVSIPFYRLRDLCREIDLIEEVFRLEGLLSVKVSPMSLRSPSQPTLEDSIFNIKRTLAFDGYLECVSSSLVGDRAIDYPSIDGSPVAMLNPLSKDHRFLRNSLWLSLLQSAKYNYRYQAQYLKLFECGKVYACDGNVADEKNTATIERVKLAALISSRTNAKDWRGKEYEQDYFTMKGSIEKLFHDNSSLQFRSVESEFLHPHQSSQIVYRDEVIGFIGKLHPSFSLKNELVENTYICELSLESIVNQSKNISVIRPPMSHYIFREITVDVIDNQYLITHQKISEHILSLASASLKSLDFTGYYEGGGRRSLSYRFVFEAVGISSDEINQFIDSVKTKLTEQIPTVSFRGV